MARKSAAELAVAQATELDRRPPPPADLSEYQAQVWMAVTATKPADWFQADCLPVLVAYVKHISTAAILDQQIDAIDPEALRDKDDLRHYERLLNMREKQTRLITSCATKMRLTPQSRYDEKVAFVANKKAAKSKLWE